VSLVLGDEPGISVLVEVEDKSRISCP